MQLMAYSNGKTKDPRGWLSGKHVKTKFVALVLGVTVVLLVCERRQTPAWWKLRVRRYCDAPTTREPLPGLRLLGVTVAIRHGARSAIHSPVGSQSSFDCEISSYVQERLGGPYFPPEFHNNGACLPGQLVDRGYRQHLALGSKMAKLYGLNNATWSVTVRSTSYQRTQASALAFLSGAFPTVAPEVRRSWIHVADGPESMFGADTKGVDCPRARREKAAQRDAFRADKFLLDHLDPGFLTSNATLHRSVTEVTDAFYSSRCEAHSDLCLPTMPPGRRRRRRRRLDQCLGGDDDENNNRRRRNPNLTGTLLLEADRFYCERYLGTKGGRAATRLAIYPFLREVVSGLVDNGTKNHHQLRLYSGHDVVIAPVLAALGVFDCKWPPLGSNIAFEVYESNLVRIVFNGKALSLCSSTVCPLETLSTLVESLLGPYADFQTACT